MFLVKDDRLVVNHLAGAGVPDEARRQLCAAVVVRRALGADDVTVRRAVAVLSRDADVWRSGCGKITRTLYALLACTLAQYIVCVRFCATVEVRASACCQDVQNVTVILKPWSHRSLISDSTRVASSVSCIGPTPLGLTGFVYVVQNQFAMPFLPTVVMLRPLTYG